MNLVFCFVAVIVELWPTMKKCACIAKKEIIYVFPFGIMAWLCGTIFINRRKSGESQVKISTTAEKIRENKVHNNIDFRNTNAMKIHKNVYKLKKILKCFIVMNRLKCGYFRKELAPRKKIY